MKMRPLFTFALAIASTVGGAAQAADAPAAAPATTAPSETVWARRKVELTRPFEREIVPDLVAKAAKDSAAELGVAPLRAVEITYAQIASNSKFVDIEVRLDAEYDAKAKRRADEYLMQVVRSFDAQLRERAARSSGLDTLARQVAEAQSTSRDVTQDLYRLEGEIRSLTGRADASADAVRASVPKLDDERQTLKLEVVGKKARQEALAKKIDSLTAEAIHRARGDAVAEELTKVVKAREGALARVHQLNEAKAVSQSDIAEAEVALAEARARLLERRDVVSQANGGELLTALNRELAMLSIDVAEIEAKLAATEKLLQQYEQVQPILGRAEELRQKQTLAAKSMAVAQLKLGEARINADPDDTAVQIIRAESATAEQIGWDTADPATTDPIDPNEPKQSKP